MKIFIQYTDNKFVNSCINIGDDIITASGPVDNSLYKIHYMYNFDIYIFNAGLFTNEIYQFIEEYKNTHKIIIYHDHQINHQLLGLTNIINISNIHNDNCIKIPYLLNKHIFYRTSTNNKRQNDTICFLDNYTNLPIELEKFVYPNSDMKLKVFSKQIRHQQNFGYLTEQDKAMLLNESKDYLDIDGLYTIEAKVCGSNVLKIHNGIIKEDLSDMPEYQTYMEFIESII